MPNYCILRTDKKRTLAAAIGTERHNNRTAAEYKGEKHHIIEIATQRRIKEKNKTYSRFYKDKTEGQTIRKDAVKAVEVLLGFTNGAIAPEQLKEWAGDCYRFLCRTFGAENLYSCYLHLDESTPHIHALVIPIDDKGKLSAAHYLNGRDKMRELQTAYYEQVGINYGLERGKDKRESKARHKSLKEYRAELDEEAAANEHLIENLSGYRAAFGIPSAEWDRYGTHTLTAFVNGRADAHNRIQKQKQQERYIDRGQSR